MALLELLGSFFHLADFSDVHLAVLFHRLLLDEGQEGGSVAVMDNAFSEDGTVAIKLLLFLRLDEEELDVAIDGLASVRGGDAEEDGPLLLGVQLVPYYLGISQSTVPVHDLHEIFVLLLDVRLNHLTGRHQRQLLRSDPLPEDDVLGNLEVLQFLAGVHVEDLDDLDGWVVSLLGSEGKDVAVGMGQGHLGLDLLLGQLTSCNVHRGQHRLTRRVRFPDGDLTVAFERGHSELQVPGVHLQTLQVHDLIHHEGTLLVHKIYLFIIIYPRPIYILTPIQISHYIMNRLITTPKTKPEKTDKPPGPSYPNPTIKEKEKFSMQL